MEKTIRICDNCGKEDLETFTKIKEGRIVRYSGARINKVMGRYEDEIKDRIFCNPACLIDFLKSRLVRDDMRKGDTFDLGYDRSESE